MIKKHFIFLWLFLCLLSPTVFASDELAKYSQKKVDQRPPLALERNDIENSKTVIKDIKNKVPFVNVKKEKVWHLKDFNDENFKFDESPDLFWLREIMRFISLIIEASLWLGLVVIAFLLYRYRDYWMGLIQGRNVQKKQSSLPQTLFGLDVREENLPDDIEKSAQQLWQSQHYRDAISLLYRGALASLFKEFEFDLPAGATEHDCLRYIQHCLQKNKASQTVTDARLQAFKLLTEVWVEVAYAHTLPQENVFQQLCKNGSVNFSQQQEIK